MFQMFISFTKLKPNNPKKSPSLFPHGQEMMEKEWFNRFNLSIVVLGIFLLKSLLFKYKHHLYDLENHLK